MADHKQGRHTTFTQEIGDEICRRLEDGNSLHKICKELDLKRSTVRDWAKNEKLESFPANYARAREAGVFALQDESLELADNVELDRLAIEKAKLQIDIRKFLVAQYLKGKGESEDPQKQELEPLKLIVKDAKPRG